MQRAQVSLINAGTCWSKCPQLAPAASFAGFYNLFVLHYLFLQLLRRRVGTALCESMAEQLC